jgi:hypothetical protein
MTEENTTTENTEAPGFGINDLVFTLQVFEAATSRGAFRAEELSSVGAVYDKLRAFLTANGAIPSPAAPPTGDQ